jgi:hypothetical protein
MSISVVELLSAVTTMRTKHCSVYHQASPCKLSAAAAIEISDRRSDAHLHLPIATQFAVDKYTANMSDMPCLLPLLT